MSTKCKWLPVLLVCLFILNSCKTTIPVQEKESGSITETERDLPPEEIPVAVVEPSPEENVAEVETIRKSTPVMREFRAAWVATVANINWPSKPGLSTADQQKEAVKLLDYLKDHNFNAVIFQVRPQADALYESDLEPWSYFLTGEQGKAPEPYYDPLNFWIKEAHDRGLELHVWLNPYRAHHTTKGEISKESIIKTNPELVVKLKNGYWWMDPSIQGTQDHSAAVVMDLVKRYDIDGVHFDDYFYPYASYNNNEDFPDHVSWKKYQDGGGTLSRGDWRRESVNTFIERVYKEIKAEKPHVKFGLSPFGIWRPGYPASIAGLDQYHELYADAKLWLNKGWIDYFTPQLYWKINQTPQSFPVLLGWWESENTKSRHLWPGLNVGLGGDEKDNFETVSQIMITRGMLPNSKGAVHWSISPLVKHPELSTALLEGPYKNQALVPSSPWLNNDIPEIPIVATSFYSDKINISWEHTNSTEIFRWVVYFKYNNGPWNYRILNKNENSLELKRMQEGKKTTISHIGVTAVNRTGNESDFNEISIK